MLFCIPMWFVPNGIQSPDDFRNLDWLSTRLFDANLYRSLHEFGQFPLWSPYLGGGYPVYMHPTDASLTPLAVAPALFGEVYGVKINLMLLLFLGAWGVFLLARDILKAGNIGALFAAFAYLVSGWFPSMMLVGFYNMAVYHFVPLILYFLFRAFDHWRYAIVAGLLLALFSWIAVWGIAATALFAVILVVLKSFSRPDGRWRFSWRPVLALGLALAVMCSVAGPRLWQIQHLRQQGYYPHDEDLDDKPYEERSSWQRFYQSAGHFAHALVTHVEKEAKYDKYNLPATPEYDSLGVPWPAVILFLFGAWFGRRRLWPWLIAGGLFVWWCFGSRAPLDLYRYTIWQIPLLSAMGDVYKYLNYFIMLVVVLAAAPAFPKLLAATRGRAWRKPLLIIAFLSVLPFAVMNASCWAELFKLPAPMLPPTASIYHVKSQARPPLDLFSKGLNYREMLRPYQYLAYYNLTRGVGTIDWYADIYLPEYAVAKYLGDPAGRPTLNPRYRGEAYLVDGEAGTILDIDIAANTIAIEAETSRPTLLVINQNHDPGWRTDTGALTSHAGLLAVNLTAPGRQRVELCFRPPMFYLGLVIMLTSLLVWLLVWIWTRPKRPASSAA
ncbi:MAG: hypothetical protein P9L99_10930 [Candidatus Lernaella stagnicola]|nr:hypothetical protein [Candidatus Lernaella stagnicola]